MIMINYIVLIKNFMNLYMKFLEVQNVMLINNVQIRYIFKKVMEKVFFFFLKLNYVVNYNYMYFMFMVYIYIVYI